MTYPIPRPGRGAGRRTTAGRILASPAARIEHLARRAANKPPGSWPRSKRGPQPDHVATGFLARRAPRRSKPVRSVWLSGQFAYMADRLDGDRAEPEQASEHDHVAEAPPAVAVSWLRGVVADGRGRQGSDASGCWRLITESDGLATRYPPSLRRRVGTQLPGEPCTAYPASLAGSPRGRGRRQHRLPRARIQPARRRLPDGHDDYHGRVPRGPSAGRGGKIFTITLIVVGVGTALYAFGVVLESLVEGHLHQHFERRRMERSIARMSGHTIVCGCGPGGPRGRWLPGRAGRGGRGDRPGPGAGGGGHLSRAHRGCNRR